jgi:hypothetical protein
MLRTDVANTLEDWSALCAQEGDNGFIRGKIGRDEIKKRAAFLSKAPDKAIDTFLASTKFAGGGLAHAEYSALKPYLSDSEVRSLFREFGFGDGLFKDWNDKECRSAGTCSPLTACICTANCIKMKEA